MKIEKSRKFSSINQKKKDHAGDIKEYQNMKKKKTSFAE